MNDGTLCACCQTMLGNYKECFVCRVVGLGVVANAGLVQEKMKTMLQDLRKQSDCDLPDAGLLQENRRTLLELEDPMKTIKLRVMMLSLKEKKLHHDTSRTQNL